MTGASPNADRVLGSSPSRRVCGVYEALFLYLCSSPICGGPQQKRFIFRRLQYRGNNDKNVNGRDDRIEIEAKCFGADVACEAIRLVVDLWLNGSEGLERGLAIGNIYDLTHATWIDIRV